MSSIEKQPVYSFFYEVTCNKGWILIHLSIEELRVKFLWFKPLSLETTQIMSSNKHYVLSEKI